MSEDPSLSRIALAFEAIEKGISDTGAMPWRSPDGGSVGNVTEAIIFHGQQLGRVAEALEEIARAMEENNE